MDNCFKKVNEGVETFNDIWNKLQSATNPNQKDKYEGDLKKEIKKLQRHRDQIKTWAASNDVKDKDQLLNYRRLIETQMEKFKVVERETKTKAYSKEGLQAASKVDPAQKEIEETEEWLRDNIKEMKIKSEMYDCQLTSLVPSSRKKKLDQHKMDKVDQLKRYMAMMNFHMENLEKVLRMLHNKTITADMAKEVKDDIEYFMESHEDPDYEHNVYLYLDLDLGLEEPLSTPASVPVQAASPTDTVNSDEGAVSKTASKTDDGKKKDESSTPRKQSTTAVVVKKAVKSQKSLSESDKKSAAAQDMSFLAKQQQPQAVSSDQPKQNMWHTNSLVKDSSNTNSSSDAHRSAVNQLVNTVETLNLNKTQAAATATTVSMATSQPSVAVSSINQVKSPVSLNQSGQQMSNGNAIVSQQHGFMTSQDQHVNIDQSMFTASNNPDQMILSASQEQRQAARDLPDPKITPLQGVAPLGPVQLTPENVAQRLNLEAAFRHMPHPSDCEVQRHYLPRNPCNTPTYYPQQPVPHHDTLEYYMRLSTETLFFNFYYMEGTESQMMAARALKKQSWRFHTQYLMWFQRYEEPKTITEEYEQGTYIYFDYERWGQCKKEQFTFEYRFLEDQDLQSVN